MVPAGESLSRLERARALFEIGRPGTSAVAPLLALLGARLGGLDLTAERLVALFAGWFLLTFAVFVVNDCFDAAIDAVVDPGRPIPSGRISPALARRLAATAGLVGVGLLGLVGPALGQRR